VNKTTASATQFAKCILLHACSRTTAAPNCARANKNFILLISRAGRKVFLVINQEQIKNNWGWKSLKS